MPFRHVPDFPMCTRIDEATNVICECFCEAEPHQMDYSWHIRILSFPMSSHYRYRKQTKYWQVPGLGDDTANVAALMMGIQYLAEQQLRPQTNVVFVFNSCEEGLGNLKGCRVIMEQYQGKVHEFISFDGSYTSLTTVAVGSERYDVCIKTEGGHSDMECRQFQCHRRHGRVNLPPLYHRCQKVPRANHLQRRYYYRRYLCNTIAQEAHMLFEFRSDRIEGLSGIKQDVLKLFSDFGRRFDLTLQLLGRRPSMGAVDPAHMNRLIGEISSHHCPRKQAKPQLFLQRLHRLLQYSAFSAESPLSVLRAYLGKGAHTRQEFLYKQSLRPGLRILIHTLLRKFR